MRIGVLGSTRGTSLLPLLHAVETGVLSAEIAVTVSHRAEAGILAKAKDAGVPAVCIDPAGQTRTEFDKKLCTVFRAHRVDLILLIGYLRWLSPVILQAWPGRILNVHPSLLPDFAGLMDRQVHAAVLAAGVKETGCTVHAVTEAVDAGPVLVQKKCVVLPDDTVETLRARVQALEGQALLDAVALFDEESIDA